MKRITRTLSVILWMAFLCNWPSGATAQNCRPDTQAPTIDCSTAGPQNLLANSSFETNNGHNTQGAAGWVQFGPVFALNQNNIGTAQNGNFYMKMFSANSGLFQDIPINGGDNLTGTVYMQNASFDPTNQVGGGQIKLEWIGVPGVATSPVFTALNPQDVWTLITINATAPPGATGVRFVIICNQPAGGAVMYDNARLVNNTQSGGGLAGDVSVSNDPGACGAQLAIATPATNDNCGVASITNDFTGTGNASGFYPIGTTTVTWTVNDGGLGTPTSDVAVISSTSQPSWKGEVIGKLVATGAFSSVTGINAEASTPSLATLQQYDAVLVWNDDPFFNTTALGNNLAAYVDGGGGVVVNMFAPLRPSIFSLGGNIRNGYLPLEGNPVGFAIGSGLTLNTVNASHPIMDGVNSFNIGSRGFYGTNLSTQNGGTRLANYSNGVPMIAAGSPSNGRTVSLNFFAPSSDSRFDLWVSSTDGALIMANSLLWASGFVKTGNTATCSVDITVTDTEAPSLSCSQGVGSGNLLNAASFEDANGNNTPYNSSSWTRFGLQPFALNIAPLQDGNFYVKLFGSNTGLFQDHPVQAGDVVDASAFIKSASFDPMKPGCEALIKLEYNNGTVVESNKLGGSLPLDTWTQVSISDVAPAGATSVRFVAIMGCPQTSATPGAAMFDNTSLTVTSPNAGLVGDVTVDNDPGQCGAQLSLAVPVSGDNCPGSTLSNDFNNSGDASGFYPVGTTTVNWTATDASGLSTTCSIDVTVNLSTQSGGECKRCDALMTADWDFNNPNCVTVTSCKDLSNVVLRDCQGNDYKFQSFSNNQQSATLCHPSGLAVETVWIKSGCFRSGDGPGYGRRFDFCPVSGCPTSKVAQGQAAELSSVPTLKYYPNPFSDEVTFQIGIELAAQTEVRITDISGKLIRVVQLGMLESGSHAFVWNGKDNTGVSQTNGMYFVMVRTGEHVETVKVVLQK